MHCREPKETAFRYNKYIVNGKLFCTIAYDARKRTQNNSVCVPTIDGEMYYRKLTEIIGVEYYDKTKYILFKCDWVDIMRDIGYKVDKCGLVLVNFKNCVNRGELITNELYVLTT
jgi:hypothetical protein